MAACRMGTNVLLTRLAIQQQSAPSGFCPRDTQRHTKQRQPPPAFVGVLLTSYLSPVTSDMGENQRHGGLHSHLTCPC